MNRVPVALIVITGVVVVGVLVYSALGGPGCGGHGGHRGGAEHPAANHQVQHQAHDHNAAGQRPSPASHEGHEHGGHCPHCPRHDHDHEHDPCDGHPPDSRHAPGHGPAHAPGHAPTHDNHAQHPAAAEQMMRGSDEALRLRAVAFTTIEVAGTDPQVLLALGDQLELTAAQRQTLQALTDRTRTVALQRLSPEQRQALRGLGEQPFGMTDIHDQMIRHRHGEDYCPDHDGDGMIEHCPIMRKAHSDAKPPADRPAAPATPAVPRDEHTEHAH